VLRFSEFDLRKANADLHGAVSDSSNDDANVRHICRQVRVQFSGWVVLLGG